MNTLWEPNYHRMNIKQLGFFVSPNIRKRNLHACINFTPYVDVIVVSNHFFNPSYMAWSTTFLDSNLLFFFSLTFSPPYIAIHEYYIKNYLEHESFLYFIKGKLIFCIFGRWFSKRQHLELLHTTHYLDKSTSR